MIILLCICYNIKNCALQPVSEETMIKDSKKLNYGWVIIALICIGISLPNYAQYQLSVYGSQIMEKLHLTSSQYSTIATAPLLPGIFLSLISGVLVDRFGARKVVTISVVITCIASVLRVFSEGFWTLYLSMIFIGVCATFLNANTPKILGQWFSPEKMGSKMSFFSAAANIGIALGMGTATLYSGMKGAFTGSAVFAAIIAVLWIVFMREKEDVVSEKAAVQEEKVSILEALKISVKSKTVWLAAVTMFLSVGAMTSFSNFLPVALQDVRGLPASTAGVISMALTLGALLGCFLTPYLCRKMKNQKVLFVIYGVVAALGISLVWKLTTNNVLLFVLIFITGIACNGFAPLITSLPIQDERIGTKYGGTAGGLVATIQLGGSVIIPSYIIAPIAGTNYTLMFGLFGVMSLLFIVFAMFLPEFKAGK